MRAPRKLTGSGVLAQILRGYQGLCKVLQGTLPGVALGTPVPPAVLARRVAALAESCCLSPSSDQEQATISDTEVVLYLVGAFLQAPFWRFEVLRPPAAASATAELCPAASLPKLSFFGTVGRATAPPRGVRRRRRLTGSSHRGRPTSGRTCGFMATRYTHGP